MSKNVNPTKVIVPCRFSYFNGWEPTSVNGSDPKYSVSAIIPKSDTASIEAIKAAIEQAKKADKSKYTEEAWQALQSQIAAAQKVYDDKDAKQADVDAAQDALDKAFWATKVEQKPGSQQPGVTDTDKDDKDNKGDRVPPTGAAVSVVAAAAVLLTAAGVTILKRRQSGDHGSARHSA